MTEDEWQPLSPDKRRKAEERLKQDKILLDRAFKKGQFSSEYCIGKVNELKVKYGLAPPVWTEDEARELDTELDAALEETDAVEEHEWEELSPEEREKAVKKLLKEKKMLNKAYKLGKISREKCAAKVRVLEVELGLAPPPDEASEQEFQEFLESGAGGQDDPLFEDLDEDEEEPEGMPLVEDPEERPLDGEVDDLEERPPDDEIDNPEDPPPDEDTEESPEELPLDDEIENPEERPPEDEIEDPEDQPSGDEEDATEEWDSGAVGGKDEEVQETVEELSLHDEVDELESLSLDDEADELESLSLDDDSTPDEPVWTPLSPKKRKEAKKELQKFNKDLAKAFNKGEVTPDECVIRRKEKEVELGLAPPPESEPMEEPLSEEEPEPLAEQVYEDVAEEPEEPLAEEVSEDVEEESEEPLAEQDYEDVVEEEEPSLEEEEPEETKQEVISPREDALSKMTKVPGIGIYKAGILYDAGFRNVFDLQEAGFEELSQIKHIGPKTAQIIIHTLSEMTSSEDETVETEEVESTFEEDHEVEAELLAVEDELVSEELKIGKTLLIIGIVLCLMGTFGVVGLRLGYIQNLLGDPTPYPGIGYAEPVGHVVSIIPFVVGLLTIVYWGIKNDSIYYELEKLKEEEEELDEEMLEQAEEEMKVESEEITDELDEGALEPEITEPPVEAEEPEAGLEETIDEPDEETLEPDAEPLVEEEEPEAEIEETIDDLDRALQEENERREYCEKMLEAAYILPADRERLSALLHTSIETEDFIEEIKIAVTRKKETDTKDEELEGELATLGDFEESDDDDSFEETILKDLEDL